MKFKNKQILVVACVAIACVAIIIGAKIHIDKVNVNNNIETKSTTIQTTTEVLATTIITTNKPTATKTTNKPSVSKVAKSTTKKTESTTKSKSVFYLSDYERRVVECIVMGESGGEPYEGQILVAQCILNGCKKEGIQPSSLRLEYQYSGWDENPTESVKRAVSAVFDDGYKATNEFVLYFYAPKYAKGEWHETQKFVREVGGHRFFAEW